MLIPPVVMLLVMFLTYYLWKRYEQVKELGLTNTKLAGNTELA